ncbi:MAG: VWA domain-containing protein [Spirochaetes bacterium]|nr:VWA domain-containing protein [Spirochaetota bacterium]
MRKVFVGLLIISLSFSVISLNAQSSDNLIQLAILLDTSNSMDGLIDQAKSQLWKIVNELALSKKNGQTPKIEVGLFEYGNSSLERNDGYIRLVSQLTGDLDLISDKLFGLVTNGGDEYCGEVIREATKKFNWSKNNNILKVIFIAGNESFDQGSYDYKKACKEAISKGIVVNTIFCGDSQEGIDTFWKDGAELADGKYINIDQNEVYAYIEAPQDKEIQKLNEDLNGTYVSYGVEGKQKKEMQTRQDSNAMEMSAESYIQRSVTKSSKNYNASSWDIVDAVNNDNVKVEDINEKELPDEMKKMSKEERKKYIDDMTKKRQEIQDKIKKLNDERNDYLNKKRAENSEKSALDTAIIEAVKDQAKSKNFKF